jgi:anti-sigma factor RsiW
MTDTERLVQRFVDQELTAGERVAFLARLGRDAALRERVLALEQLVLDVRAIPKPVVPDEFVGAVMHRAGVRPAAWRRVLDALVVPRTLQWNLAGAGAVAAIALLILGVNVAGLFTREGVIAPTPSPVFVRLVVVRPGAQTVQAAGDFNGWDPTRTPLEHISNGAWAVTIPLEPGRYEYMFVIDGQDWIADPLAPEQSDDGFGSRNAVLDVRPPSEMSL